MDIEKLFQPDPPACLEKMFLDLAKGGPGSGPRPGGGSESASTKYHVFLHGGSIDNKGPSYVASYDTKDDATSKASRMNAILSPGEKQYYGLKYRVHTDQTRPDKGEDDVR